MWRQGSCVTLGPGGMVSVQTVVEAGVAGVGGIHLNKDLTVQRLMSSMAHGLSPPETDRETATNSPVRADVICARIYGDSTLPLWFALQTM